MLLPLMLYCTRSHHTYVVGVWRVFRGEEVGGHPLQELLRLPVCSPFALPLTPHIDTRHFLVDWDWDGKFGYLFYHFKPV